MDILYAAYLAGLIDGESCISLNRQKSRNKWGFQFVAKMVIVNTSPVLLDLRKETGMGSIRSRNRKNKRHKNAYEWKLNSNDCRNALARITPYLWIKQSQAKELLKYLVCCRSISRRSAKGLKKYKNDVMDISCRIKELNAGLIMGNPSWEDHVGWFPAYLAGLIDGEGCISIVRTKVGGKYYFYPRISIGNCDKLFCDVGLKCGCGTINLRKSKRKNWRDCWIWSAQSSENCRIILEMVLPYLRIKKCQAVVVLRGYKDGFESCHEEIRKLNKRGC